MTRSSKNRRWVVVIFGPPGAGKSTLAQALSDTEGLEIFDRDDPRWQGERHFTQALRALGRSRSARAVVIRTGESRTARGRSIQMVRADENRVLETPLKECVRNIRSRARSGRMRNEIAAAKSWWRRYEPGDPKVPAPRRRVGGTAARGYGTRHQMLRRQWAPKVAAGMVACARCGEPIPPNAEWDLGHVDGDRTRYQGPEHRKCNRATAGRNKKRPSRSREW